MSFFKCNKAIEVELEPYHRIKRRYVLDDEGSGYWLEVTQSVLPPDPMSNVFDIDVDY